MQKNSSMPACASCKHQRKKCTDKCVLAPFFPAEKSREFQAVHKVFGVSNVTKIVNNLREEDRKRAIDSLVWEAFWRQRDPVLGPYGEYRKVNEELKFYKSQFQHLQAAAQGSMVYKPTPCLVGWNNNGITKNGTGIGCGDNQSNAILNYVHSNGSSIIDSTPPYNYSSNHHHHHFHGMERTTQEEDAGSVVILPQQHSIDGLNQQYYLSG